jgi:hypothetical protein
LPKLAISKNRTNGKCAYPKELDVVEDLVIEGEVITRNKINSRVLLDLPVLQTEPFALVQELIARELASPVRLGGLF